MNHKLYYSLLGDYYLHAFMPNSKTDLISDFTSTKIIENINKINDSIDNKYLGVNNKFNLKIAIAKLDYDMNLSISNMYGALINDEQYIISYLSDNVINSEQLNKLMVQYKTEKTLVYIVTQENLHMNKIIDLIIEDVDLNIQNLIYKFILMSPLNYDNITKLISGLFEVPLSLDYEIIDGYTEGYVHTNKNFYKINHDEIFKYSVGHKLKPFEPVYLIGNVNTSQFKNDRVLTQLSLLSKYDFYDFYLSKIIETIKATLIYIAIPLEIAVDHKRISFIQTILSKINIVRCSMISLKESNDTCKALAIPRTIYKSSSKLSIEESIHIDIINYKDSNHFSTISNSYLKIEKSDKFNTTSSKNLAAILKKDAEIEALQDNLLIDKKQDSLNTSESYDLSATKEELIVAKIEIQNDDFIIAGDSLNLKDNQKTNVNKKENINAIEKDKETIFGYGIDTIKLPTDKITANIVEDENINSIQSNLETAYYSKSDKLFSDSKNENLLETIYTINLKDDIKNKIFDNSNLKMYNLNEKNMKFSNSDFISLKDSDVVSKSVVDILRTLDELTVDTDTKIDK